MAARSPLPVPASGSAPAPATPGTAVPVGRRPAGSEPAWSARRSLPVRSGGMLAWVPPGRAFLDSGRLLHLQVAVGLGATAALAVLLVLYAVLQLEPRFLLLAAPAALAAAGGGALVERQLQRAEGREPPGAAPAAAPTQEADPHVDAALRARRRRVAARELAERDPALARDLRVGRPDLPHPYDDGGLVDVNSAPAAVLVSELGLSESEAAKVVRVREHLGAFRSCDDLVMLAGLGQLEVDRLADRLVAVR